LRGHSVRAALFSGTTSVLDFFVRIGSTAIMARLVLPEHFGLVMMITAVTAIADQLKDLGLSTATVQQKVITHEEITNLFWVNVGISVVIALLICAGSPMISAYYREPRLTLMTCILAGNFIFGGLMVQHQALLSRQLKFRHTSLVRLLATIVSTILGIALAWKGYGYWALIWREVARSALLTAGIWFCCPWVPGLPYLNTSIRVLMGFGAHLTAANIVSSVAGGADRFLLGRFWGPQPVAIFRQAYQLLLVPMDQLISPLYQVIQPGLGILQTDDARYRRFYTRALMMVCVATMPFSLFAAIYSAEITEFLLGPKWAECAAILCVLSLGSFIYQPVGSSLQVLITRHKSEAYLVLTLFQNAAFLLFVFVGAHWGAIGVASADVALTYVMIGPKLHYALKGSPVSMQMFFSTIARPVFASLLMAAALMLVKTALPISSVLFSLVTGGVVAGVAFIGAWMLIPGGKAEVLTLVRDLKAAAAKKSLRETEVDASVTAK
jgi:PST family polysaccharide transporter